MDAEPNPRLEYLYKEYARLSDKAEEVIKSAYDDFKLLGVVGAVIIIWKQSYAWYFVRNLQAYEIEIKKELDEGENSQIFSFNIGKQEARFITASYRLAFKTTLLSGFSVVTLLPFVILCYSNIFYAILYASISFLGLAIYIQIFRKIMKQYSNNKFL